MSRRDALVRVGIALLLLVGPIGIVWAVADGLPAYGEGAPSDAADEWVLEGTNLSAPLPILIVFALAIFAARRRSRWGTIGVGAMVLVCVLMIGASVTEPWFPAQEDSPDVLLALFHTMLYILAPAVIFLGIAELVGGRRAQATRAEGAT